MKYLNRLTHSARGELFNPLLWPSLFSTLAYGVGLILMHFTGAVGQSSLFVAMVDIGGGVLPVLWGLSAVATIVGGLSFLLFNIPPFGKISGLAGFMLWVFAGFCFALTGDYVLVFAIAIPNMYFWFWQYLSLSLFRREDARDKKTMQRYDDGEYDDELNPKDAKLDRENNRGVDLQ